MSSVSPAGIPASTFKPALMLMSGRTVAFAVTFFVPMLLVRIFSPAEFGTYKQFFLLIYMFYGIGQMGMAESLYYFLPVSPEGSGRYVVNSMLMLAGTGVVCGAVLLYFSGTIAARFNNPELASYLPLAGGYLLFMLVGCVLEIVLISRKRYRQATLSYMLSDVVRGLLLLAPALIFRSVEALLIGGLLFCIARAGVAWYYVRGEFRANLHPDSVILRKQLAYALPFAAAVVVEVLQANYHQIAVSSQFDAATFAIYTIGCMPVPLVEFMATPTSNVMMVRMGEELRDGHLNNVLAIWHDTTRKLALVFFPLVAMLMVNAGALIHTLFTEQYARSIPIFTVWVLGILGATFQTDGVMRVFARTRFLILINLARLAAIMAVMSWFLGRFELVGAVIVTLIGILVAKTMAIIRMTSLMKSSAFRILPWKALGGILLAAMLAAVPVLLINAEFDLRPFYLLILGGFVYAVSYASLVILFRILTESERQEIKRTLSPEFLVHVWNRRNS